MITCRYGVPFDEEPSEVTGELPACDEPCPDTLRSVAPPYADSDDPPSDAGA